MRPNGILVINTAVKHLTSAVFTVLDGHLDVTEYSICYIKAIHGVLHNIKEKAA